MGYVCAYVSMEYVFSSNIHLDVVLGPIGQNQYALRFKLTNMRVDFLLVNKIHQNTQNSFLYMVFEFVWVIVSVLVNVHINYKIEVTFKSIG